MKNKKGVAPFLIALTFIASMLTILSISGFLNFNVASIIGGAEYIEAPYFATISCTQSGTSKSFEGPVATAGNWISDGMPSNTNEWSVTLIENPDTTFAGSWFEYYICPQRSIRDNCLHVDLMEQRSIGPSTINIGVISSDEYIWTQHQKTQFAGFGRTEHDGGKYKVTYKPFILKRTDVFRGGTQVVAGALGCQVPYSDPAWTDRVTSTSISGVIDATSRDLEVGEDFNYVSGTITRMSAGNIQDGGYCIYANGQAKIFGIEELHTGSANYNVVDVNSAPIGTAQCCTGSNLPDATCVDGNWESTIEAECSLLNSCEGTEWRGDLTDSSRAIKYQCVSGSCQPTYKEVDCTTANQCSTNQYCNLNTFTCKDSSIVGGEGEVRIPLTQSACIEKDGNWIPEETTKTGFLGFGKVVVVDAHCDLDEKTPWTLYLAIVLVIVILFVFRSQLIAGSRFLLSKVGVKV